MRIFIPGAVIGLWFWIIAQDLTQREVSVFALGGLALLSLIGRPWYWWGVVGIALLWPWREQALALPPVALAVGMFTGPGGMAPAMALAAGILAWALGWWGGADAVALIALGVRHGAAGVVPGAVASALAGVILILVRGRSLWALPAAVPDMLSRRPVEEIPDDAEMPAAAVLGAVGVVLELVKLATFNWT